MREKKKNSFFLYLFGNLYLIFVTIEEMWIYLNS
jgi:hypothetical protein